MVEIEQTYIRLRKRNFRIILLILLLTAISGGVFLVICDTLARTLFLPVEIPIGVITALVGGPFFIVLLRRKQKVL